MTGIFNKALLLLNTLQQRFNTNPSQIDTGNQGNSPETNHHNYNQLLMILTSLFQLTDIDKDRCIFDIGFQIWDFHFK